MTTSRGGYIDAEVELEIRELADKELAPGQIYQRLASQPKFMDKLPSLRTVERRVKELRPRDPSARWDWRDEAGEDARAVLDVLQAIIERTQGRKTALTIRESFLIQKVLKAAPGLHPWVIYLVARYVLTTEINVRVLAKRTPKDDDISEVDAFLAYRPWESVDCKKRYIDAVDNEWIRSLPDMDYIISMHENLSKEEEADARFDQAEGPGELDALGGVGEGPSNQQAPASDIDRSRH